MRKSYTRLLHAVYVTIAPSDIVEMMQKVVS